MKRIIQIFGLAFAFGFTGNILATSPALGVAQGDALSGVASGNLLFMKKNAANVSNVSTLMLGGYSYGARNNGIGGEFDTPAGGLLGFRLGAFSFAAHGSKSLDKSKIDMLSGGAAMGYDLLSNLSIGIYADYHHFEGGRFIDANVGLIYALRFQHEFFWGIGIYDFSFAVSALTNPFLLSNLAIKYQTVPGFSFQFFRTRFVNLYLRGSFGLDEGFSDFSLASSVTLQLFKYVHITGGTFGDDIFNFTNYFASGSIKVAYKDFSMNLYASYEQDKFVRYLDYERAEYGAGFYFDYAPPLVRLKQEDNDVVAFLKPEKVFSPNGDGRDDFMTIVLTHTRITHVRDYSFAVLDQNRQVVTIKRADLATLNKKGYFRFPNKFIWRGLNFRDQRVPEGVYNFRLVAVLKDGSQKVWNLGEIRLDNNKPTFNIYVKNKNYLLGSEEKFKFSIKDQKADTTHYEVKVLSRGKDVIYQRKLIGSESEFIWDGKIREFKYVDSGTYTFQVAAVDKAGNKRFRTIDDVQFYDEQSSVSLNMKYDIFSPNGDGRRDTLPIQLLAKQKDNIAKWQVRIISADERKEINSFDGQVILPDKVVWRGRDKKGKKVKDGVYHLIFSVLGKDDTYRHSLSYRVFLDSSAPKIKIKTNQKKFSPDADGIDDVFNVLIDVANKTDIIAYKIKIRDKTNKIIYEDSARDNIPHKFAWDGVLTSGFSVDSFERYNIEIEAMDAAGNLGISNRLNFETDLIVRRMASKVRLGEKYLLLRFPNISFARRTVELDERSMARVRRLGIYLKGNPQYNIEVIAHTDSRGSSEYNQDLSNKRANHVRLVLIKSGIKPTRIKAVGKGETELLYKEINDAFRTRNRRFEIKLTKRKKYKRRAKLDSRIRKELKDKADVETTIKNSK